MSGGGVSSQAFPHIQVEDLTMADQDALQKAIAYLDAKKQNAYYVHYDGATRSYQVVSEADLIRLVRDFAVFSDDHLRELQGYDYARWRSAIAEDRNAKRD